MRAIVLNAFRLAAAMFVTIGMAVSAFAQEVNYAYVPFRILNTGINIKATVKAVQAGKDDVVDTSTNGYVYLYLPLNGSIAVRYTDGARERLNAPAITQSHGNITLRLPAQSYQNAKIALYSVNGKRVLHGKAAATETASNISRQNVAAGAYILKVSGTDGGAFTTRLTHGGGNMNINVAFGGESASANRQLAKSAADGDWNITVSAQGYNNYTYMLKPVSGVNPTQEITLQVTNPNAMYTITFNINGGTGTVPPGQDAQAGAALTLPQGYNLSKGDGFTFGGWNTRSDGTGANYYAGASYALLANITLYAKWDAVTIANYTITFNANGGSGTPPNARTIVGGSSTTLPDANGMTKPHFTFGGWNTNLWGNGTNYSAGASYTPDGYKAAITLYAKWNHPNVTTFTDSRDSKTYKKVTIGTQTWMGENLNYNAIGSVCYDNADSNCVNFGRLYNWSTAMNGTSSSSTSPSGVRGVCPAGWHIPSDAEWGTLVNYVDSATSGTKLKFSSGWYNSNGTDDYGFSALPGGDGNGNGLYGTAGYGGNWWSATEYNSASYALTRRMYWEYEYVHRQTFGGKTDLFSVRCVADQ